MPPKTKTKTETQTPTPLDALTQRVQRTEEDLEVLAEAVDLELESPPDSFFGTALYHAKRAEPGVVKTHRVAGAVAGVATWRLAARLLEERTALPVGLASDIISGAVGMLAADGGIILGKTVRDRYAGRHKGG